MLFAWRSMLCRWNGEKEKYLSRKAKEWYIPLPYTTLYTTLSSCTCTYIYNILAIWSEVAVAGWYFTTMPPWFVADVFYAHSYVGSVYIYSFYLILMILSTSMPYIYIITIHWLLIPIHLRTFAFSVFGHFISLNSNRAYLYIQVDGPSPPSILYVFIQQHNYMYINILFQESPFPPSLSSLLFRNWFAASL